MKIGFVFTNFNNSQVTREAIHSISLNDYWDDSFIVIVDNKSDENDIELLKGIQLDFPNIRLILNNENSGYFRGLNFGIKYLRDNHKNINYIIIGNNDLVFPPDFIKSIYANRAIFEIYPVVSPDLVTLDGIHQNPHAIKKISKLRKLIYDLYFSSYRLALIISIIAKTTKKITGRKDGTQYGVAQTIYMGHGACYILGPEFFKHYDQLWAPTFLMGEEFFLSKQIESKNFKIFYEPSIIVNHQCHATMDKMPRKKLWEIAKKSHKTYRRYVKI